jgi:rubrerythrin
MAKNFKDLSEQEILALAVSLEETDGRIYADFAEGLKDDSPSSAQIFREMEAEESEHRRSLIEEYRRRFGDHIPLIRREDVKGFVRRRPVWLVRPMGLHAVRRQAELMEIETRRFYERDEKAPGRPCGGREQARLDGGEARRAAFHARGSGR